MFICKKDLHTLPNIHPHVDKDTELRREEEKTIPNSEKEKEK